MKRLLNVLILFFFCFSYLAGYGASAGMPLGYMPPPGVLTLQSSAFNAPLPLGIEFDPQNPLKFKFLMEKGSTPLDEVLLRQEGTQAIRYFLAALALPAKDLWVNLSPYESKRIAGGDLAQTDLGADLLGEDYVLKQLAASLTYPETPAGRAYWHDQQNGQEFTKVWIVPGEMLIKEDKNHAVIAKAALKVMMQEDYLAMQNNGRFDTSRSLSVSPSAKRIETNGALSDRSTVAFRTHILPLIEKEVNEGKNFSRLRQVYRAVMLAGWFRNKLRGSSLDSLYFDKSRVKGVDYSDSQIKEKIYQQYCEAFKKGAYNYVKSDRTAIKITKRQYFSGGAKLVEAGLGAPTAPLLPSDVHPDATLNVEAQWPAATIDLTKCTSQESLVQGIESWVKNVLKEKGGVVDTILFDSFVLPGAIENFYADKDEIIEVPFLVGFTDEKVEAYKVVLEYRYGAGATVRRVALRDSTWESSQLGWEYIPEKLEGGQPVAAQNRLAALALDPDLPVSKPAPAASIDSKLKPSPAAKAIDVNLTDAEAMGLGWKVKERAARLSEELDNGEENTDLVDVSFTAAAVRRDEISQAAHHGGVIKGAYNEAIECEISQGILFVRFNTKEHGILTEVFILDKAGKAVSLGPLRSAGAALVRFEKDAKLDKIAELAARNKSVAMGFIQASGEALSRRVGQVWVVKNGAHFQISGSPLGRESFDLESHLGLAMRSDKDSAHGYKPGRCVLEEHGILTVELLPAQLSLTSQAQPDTRGFTDMWRDGDLPDFDHPTVTAVGLAVQLEAWVNEDIPGAVLLRQELQEAIEAYYADKERKPSNVKFSNFGHDYVLELEWCDNARRAVLYDASRGFWNKMKDAMPLPARLAKPDTSKPVPAPYATAAGQIMLAVSAQGLANALEAWIAVDLPGVTFPDPEELRLAIEKYYKRGMEQTDRVWFHYGDEHQNHYELVLMSRYNGSRAVLFHMEDQSPKQVKETPLPVQLSQLVSPDLLRGGDDASQAFGNELRAFRGLFDQQAARAQARFAPEPRPRRGGYQSERFAPTARLPRGVSVAVAKSPAERFADLGKPRAPKPMPNVAKPATAPMPQAEKPKLESVITSGQGKEYQALAANLSAIGQRLSVDVIIKKIAEELDSESNEQQARAWLLKNKMPINRSLVDAIIAYSRRDKNIGSEKPDQPMLAPDKPAAEAPVVVPDVAPEVTATAPVSAPVAIEVKPEAKQYRPTVTNQVWHDLRDLLSAAGANSLSGTIADMARDLDNSSNVVEVRQWLSGRGIVTSDRLVDAAMAYLASIKESELPKGLITTILAASNLGESTLLAEKPAAVPVVSVVTPPTAPVVSGLDLSKARTPAPKREFGLEEENYLVFQAHQWLRQHQFAGNGKQQDALRGQISTMMKDSGQVSFLRYGPKGTYQIFLTRSEKGLWVQVFQWARSGLGELVIEAEIISAAARKPSFGDMLPEDHATLYGQVDTYLARVKNSLGKEGDEDLTEAEADTALLAQLPTEGGKPVLATCNQLEEFRVDIRRNNPWFKGKILFIDTLDGRFLWYSQDGNRAAAACCRVGKNEIYVSYRAVAADGLTAIRCDTSKILTYERSYFFSDPYPQLNDAGRAWLWKRRRYDQGRDKSSAAGQPQGQAKPSFGNMLLQDKEDLDAQLEAYFKEIRQQLRVSNVDEGVADSALVRHLGRARIGFEKPTYNQLGRLRVMLKNGSGFSGKIFFVDTPDKRTLWYSKDGQRYAAAHPSMKNNTVYISYRAIAENSFNRTLLEGLVPVRHELRYFNGDPNPKLTPGEAEWLKVRVTRDAGLVSSGKVKPCGGVDLASAMEKDTPVVSIHRSLSVPPEGGMYRNERHSTTGSAGYGITFTITGVSF